MRTAIMSLLFQAAIPLAAAGSDVLDLLPKDHEAKGWTRNGGSRLYEHAKLWEYINGGADVYLDYGFLRVATAEYVNGKRTIVLDIYEMKTTEGAFGIYANERAPTYRHIRVGAEGYHEGAALNFFQSTYYVKLTAFTDDEQTKQGLADLARLTSARIGLKKEMPSTLKLFPGAGARKHTEQFHMASYLDRKELRETWSRKYEWKGKTFTVFFSVSNAPSVVLSKLRSLKTLVNKDGVLDKEFAGVGNAVLTGEHRDTGAIVLLAAGKYLVGVHPVQDAAVVRNFLQGFLKQLR